jgi:hypothetical protein
MITQQYHFPGPRFSQHLRMQSSWLLSAAYLEIYLEDSIRGYRDFNYRQLPLLYFPGELIVMEHFINVEPGYKTFH